MAESDVLPSGGDDIDNIIQRINELESQFLLNPSRSENLVQLLELMTEKDKSVKLEVLQSLARIFTHLLESGLLSSLKHCKKGTGEASAEDKFHDWLLDTYFDYRGKLMQTFCYSANSEDSLSSLNHSMLQLVGGEAAATGNLSAFLLGKLFTRLCSHKHYPPILYQLFEKQLEFCDVTYNYLCLLRGLVVPNLPAKYSHENILQVILSVQERIPQQEDAYVYLVPLTDKQKKVEKKVYMKLLSKIWLQFLSYELPNETLIHILRIMDTNIFPNISDPRLLLDFLTSSLNAGGELSILSLKSLVILIQKHKLEYPHIYTKIYNLLQPELTYSEFFGEFLAMFDLITTSTHLPQYIIASYIKRLARLTLRAPPHSTCPILVVISNLFARHPNCIVMIHRPHREYPDGDPYLPLEQDPSKSNAIESCLWELEPLRSHYSRQVSELVTKLFRPPLQGKERSLIEYLGSYDQTIDQLIKRTLEEIEKGKIVIKKPTPILPNDQDDKSDS